MNNQHFFKKYLKYRIKYFLSAIENQSGGAKILVIKNNGGIEGIRMSNQCIWISIKDYLRIHRGVEMSVRDIKNIGGLGPETDIREFNMEDPVALEALNLICRTLNITLYFIMANRDGTIHQLCLDITGQRMLPIEIVNDGHADVVYIASYGRHFELIVEGPGYRLASRTAVRPEPYVPKIILDTNAENPKYVEAVSLKDGLERQIAELRMTLIDGRQTVSLLKRELAELQQERHIQVTAIADIKKLGLGEPEVQELSSFHITNIEFIDIQMTALTDRIEQLKRTNGKLVTQILSLVVELSRRTKS